MRDRSPSLMLVLIAGAAAPLGAARGQERDVSPPASHPVAVSLDSGFRAPRAGVEGPQVLWSGWVVEPGAGWLRLTFGAAELPGDSAREDATVVRVTSLEDGAVQELTAAGLARWRGTSAYFNGDAVLVELIGYAGSGYGAGESLAGRVEVTGATAGEVSFGARSICGPTDDRVLSSDARSARYMPSGCTSWLISDATHQFLTAGHCDVGASGVCEFNVPLSGSDGSLRHPGPADQYPVEPTSVQTRYVGVGDDFCYFGCWGNDAGQTAVERQGGFYTLAASVPAPSGNTLRVTGYGTTSAPVPATWNQVQKTHTGVYQQRNGTILSYNVDTTGGNSGSPVFLEATGVAIGIHTNAGCTSGGGSNTGTSLDNASLRAALANPRGICAPGFGEVVPPVYAAGDSTRQFGTVSYQTGAFARVGPGGLAVDGMAYDAVRGVFWVCTTDRVLASVNPATGAATTVGPLVGSSRSAAGLAYDPWAGVLYGMVQVGGRLMRIDTATAAVTPIGAPGGNNVGALDFDVHTRRIYGIDDASGGSRLVRVDAATGAQTVVGSLGAGIMDCNGLAYNPAERVFYTVNAATEQLLRVDPATGAATVVGATGSLWSSNFGMGCVGPAPCRVDFNGDGFVDFFDYDDFTACFEGGPCGDGDADFNGDGFVDFFDYDDFVAGFQAGC